MKIVFCGTPPFAIPTLKAVLAADHEVALVVTQPDRPSGRGMELVAPPVKEAALAAGLKVAQPERIKTNAEFEAELRAIAPDAILVVAYGRLIAKWMLDLPRHGNINLHASLLPKYRGAAPIQWAVANGETETGATTMRLDEGLDTGDIFLERSLTIGPDETAVELSPRLAALGAELVVETLAGLADGSLTPKKQDDAVATHATVLTRENGRLDFSAPARTLYDRWRAFQPWPGAWTLLGDKNFVIHRMKPRDEETGVGEPGALQVEGERLFVHCSSGTGLEFLEVQLEGKKRMDTAEFLRGHALKTGDKLGE